MHWRIHRVRGRAGKHSLGPELLWFDATGTAWTSNPDTVAQALLFPDAFMVTEIPEGAPPLLQRSQLDAMNMDELRDLSTQMGLDAGYRHRKHELIDAILAAEKGRAAHARGRSDVS